MSKSRGPKRIGRKTYIFDKWWLKCPNCGEKLAVKTAVNTSWCYCKSCNWEQMPHVLGSVRTAVAKFQKEYPDNTIEYPKAELAKSITKDPSDKLSVKDVAALRAILGSEPY